MVDDREIALRLARPVRPDPLVDGGQVVEHTVGLVRLVLQVSEHAGQTRQAPRRSARPSGSCRLIDRAEGSSSFREAAFHASPMSGSAAVGYILSGGVNSLAPCAPPASSPSWTASPAFETPCGPRPS